MTGCLHNNSVLWNSLLFQRASLAEKEVTSLKEQLVNHNNSGGCSSSTSCSSSGVVAMAPPPPEREDSLISSSHHKNVDYELAAKDKEVSLIH